MTRLLLAVFLLLPAVLLAQDTTTCSQLAIDLDGDLQLGAGDILMLLGGYGTNLDVDGDMIPDCQDDCVGAYDTCGVCNGPGPQVLAIDTIIITYDSIYADAIDEWLIFELERDTLLHLVCENLGCTDLAYLEYNAEANTDDGSCATLLGCADSAYIEYNPAAGVDNGSCTFLIDSNCVSPTMDGYIYDVVQIADQCWFAENLRTTAYVDGTFIPGGLTAEEWVSATSGATAVYGEGSSPCNNYSPEINSCDEAQSLAEYGRLYNWYAVDDARGLCPSGWHVPTDGEWTELEDYITSQGFPGTEGTALKSTSGWFNNGNGTNDFGFSAPPGGYRREVNDVGDFSNAGGSGFWWSSSQQGSCANCYWYRALGSGYSDIYRNSSDPRNGASVRCLKDAE